MKQLFLFGLCMLFAIFSVNTLEAQSMKHCSKKSATASADQSASVVKSSESAGMYDCSKMTKEECEMICNYICRFSGSLTSQNAGIAPSIESLENRVEASTNLYSKDNFMKLPHSQSRLNDKKTCQKPCKKTKTAKA